MTEPSDDSAPQTDGSEKLLTLFAVPKPFEGHTGLIQRNAIASWVQLQKQIDILLLGDELGVGELAAQHQIPHLPDIKTNESATPLLDSIFRTAQAAAKTPWMMYINSDVILDASLLETLSLLQQLDLEVFLAIGQRTDIDLVKPIDFATGDWHDDLQMRVTKDGSLASILCKDYFLFPRGQFNDVPAFAIGRGNWDNWMVAETVRMGAPVIDLTGHLLAIHQNHDYQHAGGRMRAYITGEEALENKRLAGGTNYVVGSVATHELTRSGGLRRRSRLPLWRFLRDLPRVTSLVVKLFRQ